MSRYVYNRGSHTIGTVRFELGTIPIILTIPHAGSWDCFEGEKLPVYKLGAVREYAAGELARRIAAIFYEQGQSLFIVEEMVKRECLSGELLDFFYDKASRTVSFCLNNFGRCYLLDLHVFVNYPPIGDYNIIFGTDHRALIKDDFDNVFSEDLIRSKRSNLPYKIYVPKPFKAKGERFGSTMGRTLAKNMKNRYPELCAMQVEIHRDLFADGANTPHLAMDFSHALYRYM